MRLLELTEGDFELHGGTTDEFPWLPCEMESLPYCGGLCSALTQSQISH